MDVADHGKKSGATVVRATAFYEEGVNKVALGTPSLESAKYVAKKLEDKGIVRMDRCPSDGVGISRPPPKSDHGGKYTWEGPVDVAESELSPMPPAVDERDPNYVDERGEIKSEEEREYVDREDEVAKEATTGVTRMVVDPKLKAILEL